MSGYTLKASDVVGDRYTILSFFDEGGMQEVYRAKDEFLGREVALKTPKSPSAKKRFSRSAIMSARVNHVNVAKTLDYVEGEQPFLAEEFIEGADLSKLLKGVVPCLPPSAVARIFHQLAKGVAASHHAGVVHRDLKPSNVISVGGSRLTEIKITDFGIAKMAEAEILEWADGDDKSVTSSKTVIGAIPYMAPESIRAFKAAGKPADIWAIGAIAYELLSGVKPFGEGLTSIPAILKGDPPAKPDYLNHLQFARQGTELYDLIIMCFGRDEGSRIDAEALVIKCEELCYSLGVYEEGVVSNRHNAYWGFIRPVAGGDLFYHRENFYGDRAIRQGDPVMFVRHPGGGSDRAFPVVKRRQPRT